MSLIDPPIIPTKTNIISTPINISKKSIALHGLKKPKIIIREGQPETIIKDSHNKDDNKNLGYIIKKEGNIFNLEIRNNINEFLKYSFTSDITFNRNCNNKNLLELINIQNIYDIFNKSKFTNFSTLADKVLNDNRIDFIDFTKNVNKEKNKEGFIKIEIDGKNEYIDGDILFMCKKILYDVSTDFFTNTVFKNQETIFTFQFFINRIFSDIINKYIIDNKLQENDIIFLFKGGTTMKILFDTYHKYFKNNQDSVYKDYFKRSDSDYSIFINPYINNASYHRKQIIKIIVIALQHIKNILNNCNNTFFDFDFNETNLLNLIKKYNDEIKKNTTLDSSGKKSNCHDILDNINVVGVLFKDKIVFINDAEKTDFFNKTRLYDINNVDEIFSKNKSKYFPQILEELQSEGGKRQDFYVSDNKLYFFMDDFEYINNKNDIYLTYNDNILKNENQEYQRIFSLLRLKYNFVIFYKRNNKYGTLSVPSELIDISIPKLSDSDLKHAYLNINSYISNYHFDKFLTLNYNSYSIDGYIQDFTNSLFFENNSPWSDPKYLKKIIRLSYFILIKLLTLNISIEQKIFIIDKLIQVFTYSYNPTNIQLINKHLDELEEFTNDITIKYLVNGLRVIYQPKPVYYYYKKIHDSIIEYLIQNPHLYIDFKTKMIQNLNINKNIILNIKYIYRENTVPTLGGYYHKYLKYKTKYLELKNKLS